MTLQNLTKTKWPVVKQAMEKYNQGRKKES